MSIKYEKKQKTQCSKLARTNFGNIFVQCETEQNERKSVNENKNQNIKLGEGGERGESQK